MLDTILFYLTKFKAIYANSVAIPPFPTITILFAFRIFSEKPEILINMISVTCFENGAKLEIIKDHGALEVWEVSNDRGLLLLSDAWGTINGWTSTDK